MLTVASLAYLLLAGAPNEASEDTNEISTQSAQYVVATNSPLKYQKPTSSVFCSCVNTAKWLLYGNTEQVWGNASQIVPNASKPAPGMIVITNEGGGHVALITAVYDDYIHVREGNYFRCQLSERDILLSDPLIRGYRQY